MVKNAFGDNIPQIKELLKNKEIRDYVEKVLKRVLSHLEIKDVEELIELTISKAMNYTDLNEYETEVHRIFDKKRVTQRIPTKLANRSQLIFEQIKDYLKGHDILDLGCGDGKLGEIIANTQPRQVILVDVYEPGNIANINLPFGLIKQNRKIPFLDDNFDTTLLLTVLHHSDDPIMVLEEAKRVTRKGGRIIIIESVFGVDGYDKLDENEQRLTNIFFDHFYNRIIHYSEFPENKVNVPFNFKKPDQWNKLFIKMGFVIEETKHLGFDQEAVPEYHTLHVIRVNK